MKIIDFKKTGREEDLPQKHLSADRLRSVARRSSDAHAKGVKRPSSLVTIGDDENFLQSPAELSVFGLPSDQPFVHFSCKSPRLVEKVQKNRKAFVAPKCDVA